MASHFIHKGGVCLIYCDNYHEVNYCVESTGSGYSDEFLVSSTSASSNIRADIPLEFIYHVKIWGQLRSHNKLPLAGLTVKLLQIDLTSCPLACLDLGETSTDANGFYYFDLPNQSSVCYQIIIHSNNPLNNKILSPNLNPCQVQDEFLACCYRPLMDYLSKHFPHTYSAKHLVPYTHTTPLSATIYAIPCYR